MSRARRALLGLGLALAASAAPAAPQAGAAAGHEARPALGLIVRLKDAAGEARRQNAPGAGTAAPLALREEGADEVRWRAVVQGGGLEGRAWRRVGARARLLAADRVLAPDEARELARRLSERPEVAWVEPNVLERRLQATVTPDDPLFEQQWWLKPVAGSDSNAKQDRRRGVPGLQTAWSTGGTGSDGGLIAVLDTGVTSHPELTGRVVAGYDFVSDVDLANDGNGRDSNPADPGDWVSEEDRAREPGRFGDCEVSDSSWHGTKVAGLLAALTDNRQGVAAAQWRGRLLPVRVAGKCGATVADIVDGMRWAAGLPVANVPPNPNPARIVTISFGGDAACSRAYQEAIDALRARGTLVVAAAGNGQGRVSRPASCEGVVGVGAVNRDGFKASYANFGPELAISTVGGDPSGEGEWGSLLGDTGLLGIDNAGTRGPAAAGYAFLFGTSFSTPVVAATVGLMLAANPQLSVGELAEGLRRSARPHITSSFIAACSSENPGRCLCSTTTCGAGLLDAPEALRYAADPAGFVALARSPAVNDSAEVRAAAALGPDAPPRDSGSGLEGSDDDGGGGGGVLGAGWLLALVAAAAAAARARRGDGRDPADR